MMATIVIFAENKAAFYEESFAHFTPGAGAPRCGGRGKDKNIALGERVPEVKVPAWLGERNPPPPRA